MHRQAIHRGRVSYEPNSLGGGCPFQAGNTGFVSVAAAMEPETHKVRGSPEKFAEHYAQARLFFNSQTPVEQEHIINAFRFELSRVQVPAIRERMVAGLRNVDDGLAAAVAEGLGIRNLPAPLPRALEREVTPEVTKSPALSLTARPGDGTIRTRRVAILVADDANVGDLREISDGLMERGAVPRFVGTRLGRVEGRDGEIEVDVPVDAAPSVLFDAVVVAGGNAGAALAGDGRIVEFVKDQYRHCKPILVFGNDSLVLTKAGVPLDVNADPGLVLAEPDDVGPAFEVFVTALAGHRAFDRETYPALV
jgi:catalase